MYVGMIFTAKPKIRRTVHDTDDLFFEVLFLVT